MKSATVPKASPDGNWHGAFENAPPSPARKRVLAVLVLSPHPSVHGGVSVFAQMIKAHFTRTNPTSLWLGSSQHKEESPFAVIKRLCSTLYEVVRAMRRQYFDVVHINPSLVYKSLFRDGMILFVLRVMGYRRVLVYIHGWEPEFASRLERSYFRKRCWAWLLNGTSHVMVLAPQFKTALIDMGVRPEIITFTRTMFDGKSLRAVEDTLETPARRSVLYMSRFERNKGVYELMEAFGRVAADFPDVDLVMAGDGFESAGLRKMATDLNLGERVSFPGYVVGEEKVRMLFASTLFALPTYFGEGMPVALLEAMGAGKPLLTAKAGSIEYIINDPDNGIVLDKVTTDSVEAALRKLLGNPAYCEEAGKRNAKYAWERFEAAAVTAEIEGFYEQIAKIK